MKFSIIIPIYKVEVYLHQCVDSVLAQSYKNIEVILVDDGSPDSCPRICDEYAAKDERIKVIHKPNGGLSDARNSGLKIANGDYVIFWTLTIIIITHSSCRIFMTNYFLRMPMCCSLEGFISLMVITILLIGKLHTTKV